jgi:prepilin-type N-terminal cleavage/methylation domain-containing protein
MRKHSAGFTLLELLIVLALVGIGAVFAIASVDRLASRIDERRWSDLTQQALTKLRNKAVMSGVTVKAAVNFEGGELLQIGEAEPQKIMVLPTRFHFVPPSHGSWVEGAQIRQTPLYFYPDGTFDEATFDLLMPSEGRRRYRLARFSGKIERTNVIQL